MANISNVRALLPPFRNEVMVITKKQNTNDIIKEVIEVHGLYETDYDKIFHLFDTGDIYSTSRGIWEFCKYNLRYVVESEDVQSTKSPSAILQPGETVDCKHYSLFIGGLLDAISANKVEDWTWNYRFASYDNNRSVEHVFVVVKLNDGSEIWIDPVLRGFNERLKPTYFKDKEPMALVRISGIGATDETKTIEVSSEAAENNFLVLVNLNSFGLKSLLKSNPDIVNGSVKDYFTANGYDFSRLQNMLRY
jgi:hypothetical protein